MRRTSLSLVAAAAVLLVFASAAVPTSAAVGQDAPATGPEAFAGTWRYSGSADHGTRIIHRAVDRTVEPMNFIVRGIAAGRLRDKNQLVRQITIGVAGQDVSVDFDGNRQYRTALGQWRQHRFDGDSINVQFRYQGGAIVQLFRSDSGTRRNVYRMLPDGRMRLEVTVQSDQLPRDMTYRLVYRR